MVVPPQPLVSYELVLIRRHDDLQVTSTSMDSFWLLSIPIRCPHLEIASSCLFLLSWRSLSATVEKTERTERPFVSHRTSVRNTWKLTQRALSSPVQFLMSRPWIPRRNNGRSRAQRSETHCLLHLGSPKRISYLWLTIS